MRPSSPRTRTLVGVVIVDTTGVVVDDHDSFSSFFCAEDFCQIDITTTTTARNEWMNGWLHESRTIARWRRTKDARRSGGAHVMDALANDGGDE